MMKKRGAFTVYFGNRGRAGNGCQFCIYDKAAESGGQIDAVRFEVRFYRDRAVKAFEMLDVARLSAVLDGFVGGAIDFFDDDGTVAGRTWMAHAFPVVAGYSG